MNLAMMLHLIRKDVRSRWSDVAALWILLALYAVMPLIAPQADYVLAQGPMDLWLFVTSMFLMLCMLGLLASLLTDFIQMDHPRATDAFLHTRPVHRWSFALAKFLAWMLVGVLPALGAVMTRLALMRLDLRLSDYLRIGLKDALLLAGIYGMVAIVAAIFLKRRLALVIAVVMIMALSVVAQVMNMPMADVTDGMGFKASVMEKSRTLAAWCLLLAGGHVLVGGLLARVRWKGAFLLWAVPIFLWGMARLFWPVNLMWREGPPAGEDAPRLAQLQKKVTLNANGGLHLSYFSHSPSAFLGIAGGGDGLEFPEPAGYEAKVLFANGRHWQSSCGPGEFHDLRFFSDANEGKFLPGPLPIPGEQGLRVLGVPQDPALYGAHGAVQAALTFPEDKDVPLHGPAHLTSQVTLQWFRPVVLAALPLKPGSSFAHDGHRVRILDVSHQGSVLSLHLCLQHCRCWVHFMQDFDGDPYMTLCVVNPVHGQFAVLNNRLNRPNAFYSTILEVESADVAATYGVPQATGPLTITNQWLNEAKLYVLAKQPIGQTRQSFDGDIMTDLSEREYGPVDQKIANPSNKK